MSKPATRAPCSAKPNATARPCPCAAPVINATFPSKSSAMLHSRRRFSIAVCVQVFIQVHFQHIVDEVGSDHQSGKSGQGDELFWGEETGQLLVKVIRDAVTMPGQCAAKLHEHLPFRVEL